MGEGQQNSQSEVSWTDLVDKIRRGEPAGMERLYRVFSRGIRFHLCRHLGPEELDDRLHDAFLSVVQAIQRGELREPERLMGFVRTLVRRQVAGYIDQAVRVRRDFTDLELTPSISDQCKNPEERMIAGEREKIMIRVMKSNSPRDREILTRFYLLEQSQEQILRRDEPHRNPIPQFEVPRQGPLQRSGQEKVPQTSLPPTCCEGPHRLPTLILVTVCVSGANPKASSDRKTPMPCKSPPEVRDRPHPRLASLHFRLNQERGALGLGGAGSLFRLHASKRTLACDLISRNCASLSAVSPQISARDCPRT